MELKSRIKSVFNDEVLKLLAAICDTKRIPSNVDKMKLVAQLLKTYDVQYEIIGGATNRFVLSIDEYIYKVALDSQGYTDNFIEYSLSPELQPFVTKTYETNGYIIVAEGVRTMTEEDFKLRRVDILKVLETLSADYLLGDVGYIKRNFTNWGIRDDGSVVILDYAYCHRGTENLFTCEVCGDGFLRYDSTYTKLKCSNSMVCNAEYDYLERKLIQGDQVDLDMIAERKEDSIVLPQGKMKVDITEDGTIDTGRKVIHNYLEHANYIKEELKMTFDNLDREKYGELLMAKIRAKTPEEREAVEKEMDRMYHDAVVEDEEPIIEYDQGDAGECDESVEMGDELTFDEVIRMMRNQSTEKSPSNREDQQITDVKDTDYVDTDSVSYDDIINKLRQKQSFTPLEPLVVSEEDYDPDNGVDISEPQLEPTGNIEPIIEEVVHELFGKNINIHELVEAMKSKNTDPDITLDGKPIDQNYGEKN